MGKIRALIDPLPVDRFAVFGYNSGQMITIKPEAERSKEPV